MLCRKIIADNPDRYFKPDQYNNEANPLAHFDTTGPEIWHQTSGRITHFVAGIGTGGTVMGTGRYLKSRNPAVKVIAVEPDDAMHGLEGLKHMASSIVPGIYHAEELDEQNGGQHRGRLRDGLRARPDRRRAGRPVVRARRWWPHCGSRADCAKDAW